MMKIVHAIPVYVPAWQFGGPVLSVSRLCEGLVEAGASVRVITTNAGLEDIPREELCKPVFVNGVEVIRYPVDRHNKPITSRALVESLPYMLRDADILHLSAIWQPLSKPIQKAAQAASVPVIHSLRGALGAYSFSRGWWKKIPYFYLVERPLLMKVQGIHVTSEQEEREIERFRLNSQSYILPNPIDLTKHCQDEQKRSNIRERLGIGMDTRLILICGRHHNKKGLDLIPQVLDSVRSFNWRMLVVGNDEDGSGKRLKTELDRLGLIERVAFMDMLPSSELTAIYNASDLLMMPSIHENFGNVAVEALACGCAVLLSDQTGVAGEISSHCPGYYGGVVPRELGLWRSWLSIWFAAPKRASSDAVKWVSRQYTKQSVASRALAVYQNIVESHAIKRQSL